MGLKVKTLNPFFIIYLFCFNSQDIFINQIKLTYMEITELVSNYPETVKTIIHLYNQKYKLDGVDCLIEDLTRKEQHDRVLISTRDGYDIKDPIQKLFCVAKNSLDHLHHLNYAEMQDVNYWIMFSNENNRYEYILKTKNLLSVDAILEEMSGIPENILLGLAEKEYLKTNNRFIKNHITITERK